MRGKISDAGYDAIQQTSPLKTPGDSLFGKTTILEPAYYFHAQINDKVNFLEKRTQKFEAISQVPKVNVSLNPDQPRILDKNGIVFIPNLGIYKQN